MTVSCSWWIVFLSLVCVRLLQESSLDFFLPRPVPNWQCPLAVRSFFILCCISDIVCVLSVVSLMSCSVPHPEPNTHVLWQNFKRTNSREPRRVFQFGSISCSGYFQKWNVILNALLQFFFDNTIFLFAIANCWRLLEHFFVCALQWGHFVWALFVRSSGYSAEWYWDLVHKNRV